MVGDPETLIVDSTLLEALHPRQVKQSAGWGGSSTGAAWARWGSFAVYGVKLHLLCSTNRVPLSYELTAANVADVLVVGELLAGAGLDGDGVTRRLSWGTWPTAAGRSVRSWPRPGCCWPPRWRGDARHSASRKVEVCLADLKRVFGMDSTLAKTLLTGLATRIAAKVAAYTYGCYVNRLLGHPQGRIKELWA